MSTLTQFTGATRPPTSIINATSTTGSNADTVGLYGLSSGHKAGLSGALTANTLTTVLSLTGQGVITFAACESVDATARTHRCKLTIDGVVVYDATTASTSTSGKGIFLVGYGTSIPPILPLPMAIQFNKSLLWEYASSVTETGKTCFTYSYRMN